MREYEIGEQSYSTFKSQRLEKDPPTKKFQVENIKQSLQEEGSEMKWEGDHPES